MRRFLAWLLGYFWLPCPRCGRMFAGFEASGHAVIMEGDGYAACCPPSAQRTTPAPRLPSAGGQT